MKDINQLAWELHSKYHSFESIKERLTNLYELGKSQGKIEAIDLSMKIIGGQITEPETECKFKHLNPEE